MFGNKRRSIQLGVHCSLHITECRNMNYKLHLVALNGHSFIIAHAFIRKSVYDTSLVSFFYSNHNIYMNT